VLADTEGLRPYHLLSLSLSLSLYIYIYIYISHSVEAIYAL
jgi:hypothetical protein